MTTEKIKEALDVSGFDLAREKKHLVYKNSNGITMLAYQQKKRTGMAGPTKSLGSGFRYISRSSVQHVSAEKKREIKVLLDRPCKFHSVFVRAVMDALLPGKPQYEILLDASENVDYYLDLIAQPGEQRTRILSENQEDFFVIATLENFAKGFCEEAKNSSDLTEEMLPSLLREHMDYVLRLAAEKNRSDYTRDTAKLRKLLHRIADLILAGASYMQIREFASENTKGLWPESDAEKCLQYTLEIIERTGAELATDKGEE